MLGLAYGRLEKNSVQYLTTARLPDLGCDPEQAYQSMPGLFKVKV